jgi:hypothetical protein
LADKELPTEKSGVTDEVKKFRERQASQRNLQKVVNQNSVTEKSEVNEIKTIPL